MLLEANTLSGDKEEWTWDFGGLPVAYLGNMQVTGGAKLTVPVAKVLEALGQRACAPREPTT